MATTSPSPNSSPSAVPPASTTPPPQPSSPPPTPTPTTTSPPLQSPPTPTTTSPPLQSPPTPTTTSPPLQSPPSNATSPPPASPLPPLPPPTVASPPPSTVSPPPLSTLPPPTVVPPPSSNSPPPNPPATSPPPPSSTPPNISPPAPSSTPPNISPPAPSSDPPASSPPPPPPSSDPPPSSPSPPSNPPASSPPPPSSSSPPPPSYNAPARTPPPPSSNPPASSPPPPSSNPPASSQPPPPSEPPNNSPPLPPRSPESSPPPPSSLPPPNSPPPPPPPTLNPPENSPPPRNNSAPTSIPTPSSGSPPASPPLNSPPRSSPSPPIIRLSPPPPSVVSPPSPSFPSPPEIPSANPPTNNSDSSAPEISNSTSNGGIGTGGTVAIGVAISLLLLGIIGIVAWCIWKRKKKVSAFNGGYIMSSSMLSSPKSDSAFLKVQLSATPIGSRSASGFVYSPTDPGGLGNSRSWFTYEELVVATNGFSAENLLGEGGFGCVYKGCLVDGREVAVKQLKIGGKQGEREFRAEVEIISRIHHRHLVSLVGYCISEEHRLLVYDYVPNNTLYFHLHGRPVMDWATRVKIAIGAARGIAYLHEDCHPRIIHRDIKSSNILLDSNFEARVSDFGLAKLALDVDSHVTTRVMGTFGYMAPEYASSGKLTEKSDVFSYGVVLLELITGRKPVDASQPLGEESLVEWARPLLGQALDTGEFEGLADPRLEKNYDDSEIFRMTEAAAACVRHSSAKRPRMGQVVRTFDSMATPDLTNGMRVGESEIFNSEEQSAEIRLFQRMAFGSQDYSTDFFGHSS